MEGSVRLCVGRGVDEPVAVHIRHGRLGQQAIARQLARRQPADGQLERAEFQSLPGLEDGVGAVDRGMLLADDISAGGRLDQRRELLGWQKLLPGNASRFTGFDEIVIGIECDHRLTTSSARHDLAGNRAGRCGLLVRRDPGGHSRKLAELFAGEHDLAGNGAAAQAVDRRVGNNDGLSRNGVHRLGLRFGGHRRLYGHHDRFGGRTGGR